MKTPNELKPTRLPVVFLPHGGGPWPFVDLGLAARDIASLSTYLRSLPGLCPAPPKAVLVISAHWEERTPHVMTERRPPLIYDYHGFPAEAYQLEWPAPGDPALAERVRTLVEAAGFESGGDNRGFDHGAFVPLKVAWPGAEVPTIQLSLLSSLDPAAHLRLGRALAPLRDEGIFIVGSGMSFHDLGALRDPGRITDDFDTWLRETVVSDPPTRAARLERWSEAPGARAAHPREEHLLPLMVVAGAAGDDVGVVAYADRFMGWPILAAHFG